MADEVATIERRVVSPKYAEVRLAPAPGVDQKRMIVGYAARFYDGSIDTQCVLQSGRDGRAKVVERVMPQAFDNDMIEDLGASDIIATFNHDANMMLGRRSNGTLRLMRDDRGLRYEIDPPDTSAARDVTQLIERGDVRGSSFGFIARREKWSKDGDCTVRMLEDVKLEDVGPVAQPAYAGASAGMRSLGDNKEAMRSMDLWEKDRATVAIQSAKAQVRVAEIRLRTAKGECRAMTESVAAMVAGVCRKCAEVCQATTETLTKDACLECVECCRVCAGMCSSCDMSECAQCAAACWYCVDQCYRGPSEDCREACAQCAEACKRCAMACEKGMG